MLGDYTEQQSRFDHAFSSIATCCQITCEACSRTYFVTSPGHGDYDPGELERLHKLAEENPEEYIEVPDYSSVSSAEVGGKTVVIGCLCDPTKTISEFIESNARQLTEYLRLYWDANAEAAREALKEAEEKFKQLHPGWSSMDKAPKDSTWIVVKLQDDKIVEAHYAFDESGEEQPPFRGWFKRVGDRFDQVFPVCWRSIEEHKKC